ncbi:leucine-rich repeat and guanylate kinase domain-containing protein [Sceloporus undulatus]|uniref:leucine-rich repeat and guanylate kinase domain-containing protein n=1 Tax=Sceloporus undulatus TaxID=8520 RepID=UPI001C4A82CF|nr:leucine-rich repeat and guanylate kinase domain-containing protein [Sceloporus undulatus]
MLPARAPASPRGARQGRPERRGDAGPDALWRPPRPPSPSPSSSTAWRRRAWRSSAQLQPRRRGVRGRRGGRRGGVHRVRAGAGAGAHDGGGICGVLLEEMVAEALHKLGRSAPGTENVYLDLSLSIFHVSVSALFAELDASHNCLTTYFDFKPPKNLQVVNFAHNEIPEMRDLSAYTSLTKLILDNNNITEIRGLENCHNLTYLSLANNKITEISGLKNLPIKTLCLKSNQIEKAVGLEELKVLQVLDLSGNQISSLEGLEEHSLLEEINLEDNQVSELNELEYIESLPLLRVLNLLNNPVQEHPDYWLLVIFMLLRLTELDHKKITVQEKVAAVNKYDPPPEVVAAQDHMTHIMYSMMQPQRIFNSTLPSLDAPYPMLVLTGPLECWKRELCHRLCRKFNNYFRYSPCHTTRSAYFGEENRLDYYFIPQEEFDKMVTTGQFIATFKYSGFSYGLGRDTIESIAREGLATCVHMEIEGVRSLKNSYFEPRYILLIPMNKEKYTSHLRRKGLFSRPEIDEAVNRVDMYIKLNQDCPGFFDAVFSIDDYDEAFAKLSSLIEEFLGLTQLSESQLTFPSSDSYFFAGPSKARNTIDIRGTDGVVPLSISHEFLDSSAKNYSAVIAAKLSAQKTPVEEASLLRRQLAAKQGLMGKAVSSYYQLFQRDSASTFAPMATHAQFLEPPESLMSVLSTESSLGPYQGIPPTSPGLGSGTTYSTIHHSHASSAGMFSSSRSSSWTPLLSTNEIKDGKELEHHPETREKKTHKAKAVPQHKPQVFVHPGLNRKPVLPPIPSGRKKPMGPEM